MRRLFWLILISLCCGLNSQVQAVEFKPLQAPKNELVNQVVEEEIAEPETPKALLNDDDYKFKGRVEYDQDGVMMLDDDIVKMDIQIDKPKKVLSKSVLNEGQILTEIQEERRRITPQIDEYTITPDFNSLEYTIGKFTYGTTFGTDMDSGQLEYRTKLFTRYDNKYFGALVGFGKDQYTTSGRQLESIYIAPEWKLGHGFKLIDSFKANPSAERHRNEVVLQYSPKINNSRENFKIEAGVGRSYYYSSGEEFYQFNVSTKFRL